MQEFEYVIIGGGMAADAAVGGIRRRDKSGEILVASEEFFPPYQRPPLSKKLWMDMRLEEIWLNTWQKQPHTHLYLNAVASGIDPAAHTVTFADGRQVAYQKLLLATGARSRRLPGDSRQAFYVGSAAEHVRLWQALQDPRRVMVAGGGFIGAEMAAALSQRGHEVTWIMVEPSPFANFLPPGLAERVTAAYREHGVSFTTGAAIDELSDTSTGIAARLQSGMTLEADLAVVGVGVEPRDELAQAAGLKTHSGIVVDEYLRTSNPSIWAAGDVALTHGRAMMHEDHAVTQGRAAGQNMAGAEKPYQHRSFYYSDLYQFGYEAMGDCSTQHEVVEDWVVPYEEGVVYYLAQGRVVGVLNWNVWDGMGKAEQLIEADRQFSPDELRGQIRNSEGDQ